MPRAEETVVALDRLLAAEKSALLEGRTADLDRLARRKTDLVSRMTAENGSAAALVHMKTALMRQERLMAAVRAGRQAAQTANRNKPQLRTYGPDGASGPEADQGRQIARRV